MMAIVPDCVLNTGIVSIVLYYLLLCDFKARLVFKFAISKIKQAIRFASSERCLPIMSGNRRAHVLEDHDVVLGHFSYSCYSSMVVCRRLRACLFYNFFLFINQLKINYNPCCGVLGFWGLLLSSPPMQILVSLNWMRVGFELEHWASATI